jgi:hypothetical protein
VRVDSIKLFNNIQVLNDKTLVENGQAMRELLEAASIEAQLSRRLADRSQEIALEMRKDSVAMKTVRNSLVPRCSASPRSLCVYRLLCSPFSSCPAPLLR